MLSGTDLSTDQPSDWKKGKYQSPIHEASSDFEAKMSSSSSCGSKMALKPKTMPTLSDVVTKTIPPETNLK